MVCLPCDFKILLTVFNQSYNCQTSHYLGRNLLPKVFLMLPSLLRTNSKNLQFSNHGPILDFLMYCLKIQLIFGLTLYELKCPPYDLCGTCMPSGKDLHLSTQQPAQQMCTTTWQQRAWMDRLHLIARSAVVAVQAALEYLPSFSLGKHFP